MFWWISAESFSFLFLSALFQAKASPEKNTPAKSTAHYLPSEKQKKRGKNNLFWSSKSEILKVYVYMFVADQEAFFTAGTLAVSDKHRCN